MYETKDDFSIIKISDFGLARILDDEFATTACGTPGYVAPEIIAGLGYGKEVDLWSLGVIMYTLLCGYPPFYEENNTLLFKMIEAGKYQFDSPYWDDVSDNAKNLIDQLLQVNPKKRLTAEQLLAHPWIVGDSTPRKELSTFNDKMKEFNARRKFKRAAYLVMAANRFKNALKYK